MVGGWVVGTAGGTAGGSVELSVTVITSINLFLSYQTLGPFNVLILLNGWICLHGVLD